jgi:hypothetical protein
MYKGMYNKVSIGGPETALGTAVARTERLPITGLVTVTEKASKVADEVISGRGMNRRNLVNSIDVTMELPMKLMATKGIGQLFVSALGNDLATPVQVGGAIVISYKGSSPSCKLVVAADSITATKGVLGSEVADTDFGTAGAIDLTATGFDTIAELVTAINAYTDYSCSKLFGADSATTTAYAIAAAQISTKSLVIYFTSATSGVYLHRHTPVMTSAERPTVSLQADNTGLTFDICSGAVVDSLAFSADLKGQVGLTASMIATAKSTGTESTVALPTTKQLKFSGAHISMAGVDQTFVKSLAITVANNHDGDEGFGAGSLYKIDHAKGKFAVSGTAKVRTTATTEVEYAKRLTESQSSLLAIFTGEALAADIPEMVLVSVPAIDIMDATKDSSDAALDTSLTWEGIDTNSYDQPLVIDMLTKDATKYN